MRKVMTQEEVRRLALRRLTPETERYADQLADTALILYERIEEHERLCDSNYLAGLKAGWNCGLSEDNERYAAIVESRLRHT